MTAQQTTGALDRTVRGCMRHGVVAVPEHATLDSVRRAMTDHGVHAVLVEERTTGRPLGWVRAESLLTWMNLQSEPVEAHRAITERVAMIPPDASLRDAVSALSRHGVTHLLVGGDGDHVAEGVLTALDVVNAWEG
jgi:CBS domain-containing protein